MPKILAKFPWGHLQPGRQIPVGRLNSAIFDQYLTMSQKQKTKQNILQRVRSALYRMPLFSDDLE